MLGTPQDVETVLFDERKGILKYMKEGSILIDHTTNSSEMAEKIVFKSQKYGIYSLDAPVSGSDIGA